MPMIRAATSRDVPAIMALHTASILTLCRSYYSSEQLTLWTTELGGLSYASLLTSHTVIVDERDGKVCGFGVFDPRSSLINATYVEPTDVRRGVGSALMTEMMASARR